MAHPIRVEAESKYQAALAAWRTASCGSDNVAFLAAHEALKIARSAVVSAELEYPTSGEKLHAARILNLRNRGLDD